MSATISERQESLSLTVSSETLQNNSSNTEQNTQQSSSEDSANTASNIFTYTDSFEFSSSTSITSATYQAPAIQFQTDQSFQLSYSAFNFSMEREELDADVEQTLSDYFGLDTSLHSRYQSALDDLESIDPDLAEKALFLVTLMGREEAGEFLSGIADFTTEFNKSQAADMDVHVVATAGKKTNALEQAYQKIQDETDLAMEKYTSIISEKFSINFTVQSVSATSSGLCDPLIFDLDGDGIDLTTTADGVEFDIDGDGQKEQTAFIQGDDALLYLDQNNNGIADSGLELFGDQEGDANGYAELAKYDENNDGKIDNLDTIYSKLRLWQDKNSDGLNQEDESLSLLEAGIASIQLKYDNLYQEDGKGNVIGQTGEFTRTDGSTGYAADMLLRTQTISGIKTAALLEA